MARELTYPEQIAQMRQERAAREHVERLTDIQTEYQEVVKERDEAAARGDLEVFEEADTKAEALEKDWNYYNPPQPPPVHPKVLRVAQRNAPYFRKYGERGVAMADQAHSYVVDKMRISPDSPKYEDAVLSYMELHAGNHAGTPYDRTDQELDANQAAKICGMSPQEYNRCARQAWNAGKYRR
jgi:hypothetical protein